MPVDKALDQESVPLLDYSTTAYMIFSSHFCYQPIRSFAKKFRTEYCTIFLAHAIPLKGTHRIAGSLNALEEKKSRSIVINLFETSIFYLLVSPFFALLPHLPRMKFLYAAAIVFLFNHETYHVSSI